MRRLIVISMVCAFIATQAFADITFNFGTPDDYVTLTTSYQVILTQHTGSSAGGAFDVHSVNADGSIGPVMYETFCVEAVTFSPGTKYWATCDPVAYAGGLAKPGGDPISDVTEWIYDQWRADFYSESDQAAIYQAIHYAEQESTVYPTGNKIWEAAWKALGYATEPLPAGLGNAGHTYALNLWTINNGWASDVQSHLQTVPLPAAAILGMLGLGVAGLKLRKHV